VTRHFASPFLILTPFFHHAKAALALTARVEKNRSESAGFARTWRVSSVGLEMGIAVAIGWGIGYWLDGRFGTGPYLMIFFLLCGVAAGFKGMIRAAREASKAGR
jgi:ATP synthase protein I